MTNQEFKKFMPYINIKQGVIILVFKIIGIELVMLLLHFLMGKAIVLFNIHGVSVWGINIETWELAIFHIINTSWLLWVILRWMAVHYTINNIEISISTGILSKYTRSYDIRWIQEVRVQKSFLWRILWYGSVKLYNPMLWSDISLKNIQNPDMCAKLIREEINSSTNDQRIDNVILNNNIK